MSKYCSDCDFLNTKDSKYDGVYKCSKKKDYTNANNYSCENFANSYGRNSTEKQRLYDLGKVAKNKSSDISIVPYIIIVIVMFIIWIIAKIKGI